jgi:hypothetical protein
MVKKVFVSLERNFFFKKKKNSKIMETEIAGSRARRKNVDQRVSVCPQESVRAFVYSASL